jgi:hypothetical protein
MQEGRCNLLIMNLMNHVRANVVNKLDNVDKVDKVGARIVLNWKTVKNEV